MHRRTVLAACAALPLVIRAQGAWPSKPVRLIVGFPPGGGIDFTARTIQAGLEAALGQPLVVDYKPGAGGVLAATELTRAAPDGYTLLVANTGPFAIAPYLQSKMPYDPVKQFTYIGQIAETSYIAATRSEHPARDLRQFVDWARANPGQANFASGGIGASTHLNGEMLNAVAGLDLLHVPYKGAAMAVQEMIGGRIDLMFDNMSAARTPVEAGRVKALAVSPAQRVPQMASVPTVNESGVVKFDGESWMGVFAPAATPRATVDALRGIVENVLLDADFIKRIEAGGGRIMRIAPQQQSLFLKSEIERWGTLIKRYGVTAD